MGVVSTVETDEDDREVPLCRSQERDPALYKLTDVGVWVLNNIKAASYVGGRSACDGKLIPKEPPCRIG